MKEIRIKVGSPIHKAATRYEKHFGYPPRPIDGEYYIGNATEAEILAEVNRCIKENEEMSIWFGFTEEEKEAELRQTLYDHHL